jgi:mycothiol synthase
MRVILRGMNPTDPSSLVVAAVEGPQRGEALDLVFSYLPVAERQQQVAISLSVLWASGALPVGLFAARREGRLVGAILSQMHPGRSAELWLPRVRPGETEDPGKTEDTASRLLELLCQWLVEHEVRIAQLLLATATESEAALLRRWGFDHLADLLYLVCLASDFPTAQPVTPLQFEPYCGDNHQRLVAAVEATYRHTLDCPQLNGVRQIDDVLDGYRAMGEFDPGRWLLIRHEGRDVGCLVLADYPQSDNLELVYMGVVPEARGRQWGTDIVRYAQWRASQAGRPRLVLAVDAANQPAIAMYAAAGFRAWDRRRVYLKVFGERSAA